MKNIIGNREPSMEPDLTPQEVRGKRLFLILATLLFLVKLGSLWNLFRNGTELFYWIIPLAIALSIPFLWTGRAWLINLVGGACILSGMRALLAFGRDLVDFDVPGVLESLQILSAILGLLDLLSGLALLFHPNLRAFFRYQREQTGLHASAHVGIEPDISRRPCLRLAVRKGLIVATVCVLVLAGLSALSGGLFGFHPGATIFGNAPPGWGGAGTVVVFNVVMLGLPVAGVGFVVGFVASYW